MLPLVPAAFVDDDIDATPMGEESSTSHASVPDFR
jgi:hypothetical protein